MEIEVRGMSISGIAPPLSLLNPQAQQRLDIVDSTISATVIGEFMTMSTANPRQLLAQIDALQESKDDKRLQALPSAALQLLRKLGQQLEQPTEAQLHATLTALRSTMPGTTPTIAAVAIEGRRASR